LRRENNKSAGLDNTTTLKYTKSNPGNWGEVSTGSIYLSNRTANISKKKNREGRKMASERIHGNLVPTIDDGR